MNPAMNATTGPREPAAINEISSTGSAAAAHNRADRPVGLRIR